MKKSLLLVAFMLLGNALLFAQNMKITGTVTSSSGKPLEYVKVEVKGSTAFAATDHDGKYSIEAPTGSILLFSLKQMVSKEITINNTSVVVTGDENVIDVVLASTDDFFDLTLEELMDLEVTTASKTKQALSEAPASVIVITAQNIKDRGYHHLEEILHDLPGFDFNKDYGVNYSTIFMRGYRSENSDRFLLLFDGILENDIWKQTTWISRQYPVTQIKQIEVLYGPASALYGTNAFSGIINVITKKGDEVGPVNITTTGGSWGRKNIEFATGKDVGKISYNITAKYMAQDDLHQWDEYDAISGDPSNFSQTYLDKIGPKMLFNVDNKLVSEDLQQAIPSENYGIHANFKVGDLTITALNWTKKEAEAYFYNPFKRSGPWTQWYENNQGYMLSHEKAINDKVSFSTNLTYRNHALTDKPKEGGFKYYSAPLTDPTDPDYQHSQTINPADFTTFQLKPRSVNVGGVDTFVTASIYAFQLETSDISLEEKVSYVVSAKLNLIGGARYTYTDTQEDYAYTTNFSQMPVSPRHLKKNMAGYAQAIYKPVSFMSLTLGGRYEDQKDEKAKGYQIFTPRASLVVNAAKNLVFRLQYAEAFQEADDWHKFALDQDVRPRNSSELEPERLKSFEFGSTYRAGNSFLLSATGYYTIVSNFIEAVNNTPENPYRGATTGLHYANKSGSLVKIYGYEVSFNAKLPAGIMLNGNISGAYNYGTAPKMTQNADGNYVAELDGAGNTIDDTNVLIGDISPIKVNLGLLYNYNNKFSIYPKVNFVAAKSTINWRKDLNTTYVRQIEAYSIIGLNINLIDMFGFVKGLDANFKIDNVMGSKYYNAGSRSADGSKYTARVLQPGFNFMTGISYNF